LVEYNQRSKLYRFDGGAWKEKGIGEMKILKHKETGKLKVIDIETLLISVCVLSHQVLVKAMDTLRNES